MNILSWITAAIKRAVLQGFHEAVEELQLTNDPDAPDALAALKSRMTPAIAGPDAENGRVARKTK